jgi:hypothetical protein
MFRSSPLCIDVQVGRLAKGGLNAALFAAVADRALIGVRPGGGL